MKQIIIYTILLTFFLSCSRSNKDENINKSKYEHKALIDENSPTIKSPDGRILKIRSGEYTIDFIDTGLGKPTKRFVGSYNNQNPNWLYIYDVINKKHIAYNTNLSVVCEQIGEDDFRSYQVYNNVIIKTWRGIKPNMNNLKYIGIYDKKSKTGTIVGNGWQFIIINKLDKFKENRIISLK